MGEGFLHPHLPESGNDRAGGDAVLSPKEACRACLCPHCASPHSPVPCGPGSLACAFICGRGLYFLPGWRR